jgi:membrane-bound lytic murein transglycosylase A
MSYRFAVVRRLQRVAITLVACALAACVSAPPSRSPASAAPIEHVRYERADWNRLDGWRNDDVTAAWPAFMKSCDALAARIEWASICGNARLVVTTPVAIRNFFENNFSVYRVLSEAAGRPIEPPGLITGYYEPLLNGARQRSSRFSAPLYAPPDDLLTIDLSSVYPELKGKRLRGRLQGKKVVPYASRADLDNDAALRGKEIVWVENALDAFFLQVQGSGRVKLPTGETIRLQYADQNGYPYQSIGRYLVDHGELTLDQASIGGIRTWLSAHPQRFKEVLNANPSVVFFHEEKISDPSLGPKGALGVPLSAGRSIAIDPASIPLGAPVFLATTQPASEVPLQRLVIAQDTGGAIRGTVRADFYWGTGTEAGEQAGKMRQTAKMWLLWPKAVALPAG